MFRNVMLIMITASNHYVSSAKYVIPAFSKSHNSVLYTATFYIIFYIMLRYF